MHGEGGLGRRRRVARQVAARRVATDTISLASLSFGALAHWRSAGRGPATLVRRGVPQRVAMKLTGRKNRRSVRARYDIIDERDLDNAAALLNDPTVAVSVTTAPSDKVARGRK